MEDDSLPGARRGLGYRTHGDDAAKKNGSRQSGHHAEQNDAGVAPRACSDEASSCAQGVRPWKNDACAHDAPWKDGGRAIPEWDGACAHDAPRKDDDDAACGQLSACAYRHRNRRPCGRCGDACASGEPSPSRDRGDACVLSHARTYGGQSCESHMPTERPVRRPCCHRQGRELQRVLQASLQKAECNAS